MIRWYKWFSDYEYEKCISNETMKNNVKLDDVFRTASRVHSRFFV